MLLDPEHKDAINVGISLLSCMQAEIYVIPYQLPFTGRDTARYGRKKPPPIMPTVIMQEVTKGTRSAFPATGRP
jgi:hypothetical protein